MTEPLPVKVTCEKNKDGKALIGSGRKAFYTGTLKAWPRKGSKLNLKRTDTHKKDHEDFSTSKITAVEKVDDLTRRITTAHGSVYVVKVTDPSRATKEPKKVEAPETSEVEMPECPECDDNEFVLPVEGFKTKFQCDCGKVFIKRKLAKKVVEGEVVASAECSTPNVQEIAKTEEAKVIAFPVKDAPPQLPAHEGTITEEIQKDSQEQLAEAAKKEDAEVVATDSLNPPSSIGSEQDMENDEDDEE